MKDKNNDLMNWLLRLPSSSPLSLAGCPRSGHAGHVPAEVSPQLAAARPMLSACWVAMHETAPVWEPLAWCCAGEKGAAERLRVARAQKYIHGFQVQTDAHAGSTGRGACLPAPMYVGYTLNLPLSRFCQRGLIAHCIMEVVWDKNLLIIAQC